MVLAKVAPAPLRLLRALPHLLACAGAVRSDGDPEPMALLQSSTRHECKDHYYKVTGLIGGGAYGQVSRVVKTDESGTVDGTEVYAMKIYSKDGLSPTLSIQQMRSLYKTDGGKKLGPDMKMMNTSKEKDYSIVDGLSTPVRTSFYAAVAKQQELAKLGDKAREHLRKKDAAQVRDTLKRALHAWEKEDSIMDAAKQCAKLGMVEMTDRKPCLFFPYYGTDPHGEGEAEEDPWQPMPGYVMRYINGTDMQKWSDTNAGTGRWNTCFSPESSNGLFLGLASQLQCLHNADYVHQDLKPDNVFLGPDGTDGCPTSIHLGDPGIAAKKETSHYCYTADQYFGCSHIVDSMFEPEIPDSLGIRTTSKQAGQQRTETVHKYKVTPNIDWCAFILLWEQPAMLDWAVQQGHVKIGEDGRAKVQKSFKLAPSAYFGVDTATWLVNKAFLSEIPNCGMMGRFLSDKRFLQINEQLSKKKAKW